MKNKIAKNLLILAKELLSDDGGSEVEEIKEIEPEGSKPIKERRQEAAIKVKVDWSIRSSDDDATLICKLSARNESTDALVDTLDTVDIRGTNQLKGFGYRHEKVKWTIERNELVGEWFIYNFYPSADRQEMKETYETFLRAVR